MYIFYESVQLFTHVVEMLRQKARAVRCAHLLFRCEKKRDILSDALLRVCKHRHQGNASWSSTLPPQKETFSRRSAKDATQAPCDESLVVDRWGHDLPPCIYRRKCRVVRLSLPPAWPHPVSSRASKTVNVAEQNSGGRQSDTGDNSSKKSKSKSKSNSKSIDQVQSNQLKSINQSIDQSINPIKKQRHLIMRKGVGTYILQVQRIAKNTNNTGRKKLYVAFVK